MSSSGGLMAGKTGIEAVDYNEPYFSKEGTFRIGLSATGFLVTRIGEEWALMYCAWGQEPESLGKFDTRKEAEAFGILTYKLKGG